MEEIVVHENLTDQSSAVPTRKVTASTAGATAGTVVVLVASWLFGAESPPVGLEGGLSIIGAFLFGWAFRERE